MALLDEYSGPWTNDEASHLLRRAAFGGSNTQRAAAVIQGLHATVDDLVVFPPNDPYLDQPGIPGTGGIGSPFATLPNDDSELGNVKDGHNMRHLQGHLLYRMRYSTQPFQEQWALFFHDHFVSDYLKVHNSINSNVVPGNDGSVPSQQKCTTGTLPPDDLRRKKWAHDFCRSQFYLYRQEGLNSFRDMLIAVTRNPAMLLYLDNIFNIKGRAQENYAREVMELFSMGVDNYSEADIQEISKCLTGETLPYTSCESNYDYETYGFDPSLHEPGSKTVFGQNIPESSTGQELITVIDLIMNRIAINPIAANLPGPYNTLPATALYMSWKILRWFVSHSIELYPVPDPIVMELAHYMRGTDNGVYPQRRFPYDMKAVMRKLLLSEYFYDPAHRYNMVKNPVDFVITALRGLSLWEEFAKYDGPAEYTKVAGMELYGAPNVAGWHDGQSWMSSASVLTRFNYGRRLDRWVLNSNDFVVEAEGYYNSLLVANGGPLTGETDHQGMIDLFADAVMHQLPTTEERTQLLAFLNTFPAQKNTSLTFKAKIRQLIHLMVTMPQYQLK